MYYSSLQVLRGIFALVIFFHHFSFDIGGEGLFGAGGDMGVAFFFILSGFVMSQGYMKKETSSKSHESLFRFIVKRLSKIYPLHVVCLVIAILLRGTLIKPDLANLLLLQSWIPDPNWYFSGNAVGWCLSDFLFFYAVFPFFCKVIKKNYRLFLYSFFICLAFYIFIIPFIPYDYWDGIIYINPLTRLLDFLFGIILWEWLKNSGKSSLDSLSPLLAALAVLVVLAFTTIVWYVFPSAYNLSLLWWPSLALLLIYSVTAGSKILSIGPLVRFGDVSFSFYLIHVLCINFLLIIFDRYQILLNPGLELGLILALTVILSFIVHSLFVIPMEKLIRKRIG